MLTSLTCVPKLTIWALLSKRISHEAIQHAFGNHQGIADGFNDHGMHGERVLGTTLEEWQTLGWWAEAYVPPAASPTCLRSDLTLGKPPTCLSSGHTRPATFPSLTWKAFQNEWDQATKSWPVGKRGWS